MAHGTTGYMQEGKKGENFGGMGNCSRGRVLNSNGGLVGRSLGKQAQEEGYRTTLHPITVSSGPEKCIQKQKTLLIFIFLSYFRFGV